MKREYVSDSVCVRERMCVRENVCERECVCVRERGYVGTETRQVEGK